MKEYITTQTVELGPGAVLGLSKKQAAHRLMIGTIEPADKEGFYRTMEMVQFKTGEVLVFDPDKATLAKVELTQKGLDQAQAEKEAELNAEIARRQAEKDAEEARPKTENETAEAIEAAKKELDGLLEKDKPGKKEQARIAELQEFIGNPE